MIPKIFLTAVLVGYAVGSYVSDSKGHESPEPYAFGYEVKDKDGTQHRQEESDASGTVKGSYGYKDANGVYRQVNYVADKNGFRAEVKTNEPGTSSQDSADVDIKSETSHHKHDDYQHPIKHHGLSDLGVKHHGFKNIDVHHDFKDLDVNHHGFQHHGLNDFGDLDHKHHSLKDLDIEFQDFDHKDLNVKNHGFQDLDLNDFKDLDLKFQELKDEDAKHNDFKNFNIKSHGYKQPEIKHGHNGYSLQQPQVTQFFKIHTAQKPQLKKIHFKEPQLHKFSLDDLKINIPKSIGLGHQKPLSYKSFDIRGIKEPVQLGKYKYPPVSFYKGFQSSSPLHRYSYSDLLPLFASKNTKNSDLGKYSNFRELLANSDFDFNLPDFSS